MVDLGRLAVQNRQMTEARDHCSAAAAAARSWRRMVDLGRLALVAVVAVHTRIRYYLLRRTETPVRRIHLRTQKSLRIEAVLVAVHIRFPFPNYLPPPAVVVAAARTRRRSP